MRVFSRFITALFAASLILPAALATPVMAAAATHLAFSTQPTASTGGVPFPAQPVVQLQDGTNAVDTAATSAVTLTITGAPVGVVLTCTAPLNTVNAVAGVATFAGCSIDKLGSYTLTASASGLTNAVSTTVVITTGPADHVSFTAGPDAEVVTGGVPYTTQPVVEIRDAGVNRVTTSTAAVTLGIAPFANPTGTTLGGVLTVNAVAGIATFSGINID